MKLIPSSTFARTTGFLNLFYLLIFNIIYHLLQKEIHIFGLRKNEFYAIYYLINCGWPRRYFSILTLTGDF